MKNIQNKWIRGAIPALLLHCSIGTVYCWSIFSQEIADYIGFSKGAVEWAFSFAIFFLGMSAAFLGGLVEKKYSQVISDCINYICTWYGRHRLLYLVRWKQSPQRTFTRRYLHKLRFYYGYWSWYRLPLSCKDSYALV